MTIVDRLTRRELFLYGHNAENHFKAYLDTEALELGLGGAILTDLLIHGRIFVDRGRLQLTDRYDRTPVADPITSKALNVIRAAGPTVREGILLLSQGQYECSRAALIADGTLVKYRHRLRSRLRLVDPQPFGWVRGNVRTVVLGSMKDLNAWTAGLCAMLFALQLYEPLAMPTADARDGLQRIVLSIPRLAGHHPSMAIPEIVVTVHKLRGELANKAYKP